MSLLADQCAKRICFKKFAKGKIWGKGFFYSGMVYTIAIHDTHAAAAIIFFLFYGQVEAGWRQWNFYYSPYIFARKGRRKRRIEKGIQSIHYPDDTNLCRVYAKPSTAVCVWWHTEAYKTILPPVLLPCRVNFILESEKGGSWSWNIICRICKQRHKT